MWLHVSTGLLLINRTHTSDENNSGKIIWNIRVNNTINANISTDTFHISSHTHTHTPHQKDVAFY